MRYISTRGHAPDLNFCDALLTGLARDGGLYVPQQWPHFSNAEIRAMRALSYADLAKRILMPFVEGEIEADIFSSIIDDAYATFRHEAVCPLVQLDSNQFVLELFHGPTLAFKDVALQLLARLMDHVLEKRDQRVTIVGATSGDTGGAAIDAFAGRERADIFILFPTGRVSDVQQRQMTTNPHHNVHALSIDGDFDDCQSLVKEMFNNHAFRDSVNLAGVNSINWARIMAQIVYYFSSAISLGAPDRAVSYSVPTGNFGDIFAGYCAKKMGLNIDQLIIATNENDILARTMQTGRYETRAVVPTTSPSMDIQVSSNFERLLFEAGERDASSVVSAMNNLKQSGNFSIASNTLASIRTDFEAIKTSTQDTNAAIRSTLEKCNYLTEPHTSAGLVAAQKLAKSTTPMVTLATAHPAKFPIAVNDACGVSPVLPDWLSHILKCEQHFTQLPSDSKIVENYILENRS